MMTVDEIKALMSAEVEEGVEDNRLDNVYGELSERDEKISELENKVIELTTKVSEMADANAKLVEQIKYAEPEVKDEEPKEPEFEFADFEKIYEEED